MILYKYSSSIKNFSKLGGKTILKETIKELSKKENLRNTCLAKAEMEYLDQVSRINLDFLNESTIIKITLCKNDKEKDKLLQEFEQECEKISKEYIKKSEQILKRYSEQEMTLLEKTRLEIQNIV